MWIADSAVACRKGPDNVANRVVDAGLAAVTGIGSEAGVRGAARHTQGEGAGDPTGSPAPFLGPNYPLRTKSIILLVND